MPAPLSPGRGDGSAVRCPACRSADLARAYGPGGPGFLRCRSCHSLFDPSPPSPEELQGIYEGSTYFVKEPKSAPGPTLQGYPGDYIANRENVEAKFDQVLGHLERYVSPGRLVDVGAGPGFLLSAANRRGWTATG